MDGAWMECIETQEGVGTMRTYSTIRFKCDPDQSLFLQGMLIMITGGNSWKSNRTHIIQMTVNASNLLAYFEQKLGLTKTKNKHVYFVQK